MDKSKNVTPPYPQRNKQWMLSLVKTQLDAIKEGEDVLNKTLRRGIASADVEFKEKLCFNIEGMIDYYAPNVLRSFRVFFSILHHYNNSNIHPDIIVFINYLLALIGKGKRYLEFRIEEGMDPDLTSQIESHLGYYWKDQHLLMYNLFEDQAEIIQLSFDCKINKEKFSFEDKAYWMNIADGQIYITRKLRPWGAFRYIKESNSEYHVLQLERMFIYPGKTNRRIRWKGVKKRLVTVNDFSTVLNYAERNYTEMVNAMKETFRDPLAEQSPAALIKLHKAFINGDQLVLEDEFGGLLTVADQPNDRNPTTILFRSILPANADGYALLAEANNEVETGLFTVKPLSVITPDRIIRLLF